VLGLAGFPILGSGRNPHRSPWENKSVHNGSRLQLKDRLGGMALAALLGLLPAACGAQLFDSPNLFDLQLAAGDEVEAEPPPAIESPLGSYLAGLAAIQNNDLSVAADLMLHALEFDPDNPELIQQSFVLVAAEGRQDQAVALAQRVAKFNPEDTSVNVVLALDAFQRGDSDQADAILAKLPNRGLGSLLAPLLRGWIEVDRGAIDQAVEHLDILRKTDGFAVMHSLHIALMNDVAGRHGLAMAAYEEALNKSGRPTLRLAWLAGNFYERQDNKARAGEIYGQFLANNPGSTLLEPVMARLESGAAAAPTVADAGDGMAEVMFNLASLLTQERADDLALIHVQQALNLKPGFVMARVLLAEIQQDQDRAADAIATYRQIPKESEFGWMVRLRIADQLSRMEETDLAIAELDSLSAERPEQFEPMFRKANLLRAEERFDEAVEAYDAAGERLGDVEPRHWTFFYFRGIALERTGNWDRAEADFLQALDLEPDQPFVMNYLAYSWVEQKTRLDEAEQMLIRAVELRPDDGYIVDSLGWVYYRLGKFDKAVTYLEQAVELRSQDPVINDHLGDALWRVGRAMEARFQWRRSLSLEPEEDQVPIIEDKIKQGIRAMPGRK
jgi:tetratricopeptide (TPR) repeat protein